MAETNNSNEELLENFRRQWETEISSARSQQTSSVTQRRNQRRVPHGCEELLTNCEQSNEDQAASLFLSGVQHEKSGEFVEAIRYYKRAMQLVPDIEQKMYTYSKAKDNGHPNPNSLDTKDSLNNASLSIDNNNFNASNNQVHDLVEKLQQLELQKGCICMPEDDFKGTHISALPREIILYLLKWVVSSDLDLRSLEQVSLVSRGFYLCARDNEIWKQACFRVWNTQECSPKSIGFATYRDMFILRPHLYYNGCYISKASYARPGEKSFQDVNCQPWHIVNYFRYLRFYSDRSVIMSTTAEAPNLVVGKRLKRKDPSCLSGHYILQGNEVACIFKRKRIPDRIEHNRNRRRNAEMNNNDSLITEQVFKLDLEIRSVKKKLHCVLHWVRYSVETFYENREPSITHFDVNTTRFPPFWFSRVRSYHTQSERPL